MNILLIDDEPRRAQPLIAYFMEIKRWRIEQATDPDIAMGLLPQGASCPFNLIILDIMMPPGSVVPKEVSNQGKDTGLALLRILSEHTGGRVPILVYTARIDLDYLQEDPRVADFIQKPRTPREVSETIIEVMTQWEASPQ